MDETVLDGDRDARVVRGRAMWLEDGDPRLSLSSPQLFAVRSLARYPKESAEAIDAAATACGVSPGRVKRWLSSRTFREALRRERDEPVSFGFGLKASFESPRLVNVSQQKQAALESGSRPALPDTKEETDG